jgi:cell division protein ZipA
MVAELRWILFALSLVLLVGIWWWGRRRSLQAPGNAALREITPTMEPFRHDPAGDVVPDQPTVSDAQSRDWGVPPFEPLSIHTREYDHVPIVDGPMMVEADPVIAPPVRAPEPRPEAAVTPEPAASPEPAATPEPVVSPAAAAPEPRARSAVSPGQSANVSEQQKIVTVRVCAPGEIRWPGANLLAALELHGLAYGRYQVFHRKHVDGRSLFCVASMVEPGTFDVARMASEEFRGVTLFAVLPGPVEPLLTVDELLGAARGLAHELAGMVQDSKGMPLSPQRAGALRDDVARFQASLHRA